MAGLNFAAFPLELDELDEFLRPYQETSNKPSQFITETRSKFSTPVSVPWSSSTRLVRVDF